MCSIIGLPAETILAFIVSVNKSVEEHADPESDPDLKDNKRLADQLLAEAFRRQRAREAEARRSATAYRRKLETDQRREDARVESRKPGDFSSRGLI